MTSKDVERMDEGPKETWPLEIWQKLGFAPPSPAAAPSSNVDAPDDMEPDAPITAVVNICATGELYRITRDTISDPCDGEEVLVYDSVEVEVESENEDGTPLTLESATFLPEDEDFPLRCMPPAPPHIGQVGATSFCSRMQTEIQLRGTERPNVRITHSGVMVGDHHWSWETIHARGSLDQGYPATAYLHGVALSAEMKDLIFNSSPRSAEPQRIILRHLADEIDFISAHTQAAGFDGSPAGLVEAMNDEPEILMRAVLAMPWNHARRICGPAEVSQWIEENHPAITTTVDSLASSHKKLTRAMKPSDSTTRSDQSWMPSPMSMVIKMMAAVQAGRMSQEDANLMDQTEPEQWPRELWMKMGVTPPEDYEPAMTPENPA